MSSALLEWTGEGLRMPQSLEDRFHDLDKRLDVGFAEIRGAIQALAAAREGQDSRLDGRITDVDRRVENLHGSVAAVHRRIDEMPKPETLIKSAELAEDTSSRLDRLIYFMVGSGVLGGGVAGAVVSAIVGGAP